MTEIAPPRRVTLADVARRAGVSPALVSIVMREAPGASEVTRRRVLAVAQEIGYRPDKRARALASLRSHVIGVVFGRASRFHFELIDGLYAAAEDRGWDLVLTALTASRDEPKALASLQDFRLDGLVMLGPPVAEPLLAGQVPLVVVGWHVDHPEVDVIRTSDEKGLMAAVDHLADLGHRAILHLQGGTGLVAHGRREAYLRAMRAHGLEAEARVVLCDGEDQLDGQRAAAALLAEGSALPTAVIAFNDDLAAAAMSVFAQQGVAVPEEISVVGFDDSALAATPGIELTSVQQRPLELSRLAVDRLIARCERAEGLDRETVLDPQLVVRRSTGPAPADAARPRP